MAQPVTLVPQHNTGRQVTLTPATLPAAASGTATLNGTANLAVTVNAAGGNGGTTSGLFPNGSGGNAVASAHGQTGGFAQLNATAVGGAPASFQSSTAATCPQDGQTNRHFN
mgnify:CR=1 FL=1